MTYETSHIDINLVFYKMIVTALNYYMYTYPTLTILSKLSSKL